jgi:Domain of unknown function (DUF3854)
VPKVPPKPELPLIPSDLEDLRASGLTDETILSNQLRTEHDGDELATILNRLPDHPRKETPLFCQGGGLVFPYRDLSGEVNCFARVKPHHPRVRDGNPIKYEQPRGAPQRAYYPKGALPGLRDGTSPVHITEGEKKAMALSQLGLAAVGLGGFWCGCKKDESGEWVLIDTLAAIDWRDRVVYVVFDYDEKETTRREQEGARVRLTRVLKNAGAQEVYNVELPPGPNGEKQGVDDFLVDQGREGYEQLVQDAIPIIKIIPTVPGGSAATGTGTGTIPTIKIIPPCLGEPAYHGPLGQFLRGVAPFTEATDPGVLAHLVSAVGAYIGPDPYIFAGTRQHSRLNTVLVGPTSTGRKGTSFAPVDLLMEAVDYDFWAQQKVTGLATGEGLVSMVADIKTWDEEKGRYNVTPVEKRVYVIEEEYSKVLAQIRREGNILSQVLRESFDSGNLSVMIRNNPLTACGAHVAITGHITPEELHDRFNHVEMANGFGNRFLWFVVKSDKVMPKPRMIGKDKWFDNLTKAVRRAHSHPAGNVPLAEASLTEWERLYTEELREDRAGFAGQMIARGSSMVLRLALLYYLLDPRSGGDSQGDVSQGILPVHLDAAMAVWNYCRESVEMLFRGRSGTFLGDKILELLANGRMTKDQLNDHLSPKQKADAPGVLAGLEAAGHVRKVTVKREGAGRPATAWERVG